MCHLSIELLCPFVQASSTANEMANSFKSLRNYRGRTVVLVFSNQGLGNLVNTAVILALMAITGQYGPKYSQSEPLKNLLLKCIRESLSTLLWSWRPWPYLGKESECSDSNIMPCLACFVFCAMLSAVALYLVGWKRAFHACSNR